MRNKHNAFYRTDEISREPNKRVDWLDSLAEKMAVEEQASKFQSQVKTAKTAVEVSRDRNIGPSVYEMMSAIVSGTKPKFSSVEEAVLDYQDRTGLSQYLKAQAEEKKAALASVVVQAGEETFEDTEEANADDVAHAEDCGDADCAQCADTSDAEDSSDMNTGHVGSLAELIKMFLDKGEDKKDDEECGDMNVPDLDMVFDLKKKL